MAFQIKNFVSIVAGMINHMRGSQIKVTDFNIGGVARTLIEAPAVEIDELYQQMFIGLREAIPVSIFNSFDFAKQDANPAIGAIRVTVTSSAADVIIPANSEFSPVGVAVKFVSSVDFIIPAGSTYIDVKVSAKIAGIIGNVASGISFTASPVIPLSVSILAIRNFTMGAEIETDNDRKNRFVTYISSLNRGTAAALKYGLSLANVTDVNGLIIERVFFTSVIELWVANPTLPVTTIQCYIHNGIDGASSSLISSATDKMNGYYDALGNPVSGWKAAGVRCTVIAATNTLVNVTGVTTVNPQFVASSAAILVSVRAAIAGYINGLPIGAKVIYAELIAAAMAIAGVDNFILSAPTADTVITSTSKAMVGTLAIS